ncbi:MAG: YihY/virulence factor BrkB family protein [Bacteroidales bacterium]|nr:YihY/virulence factor BrkB family protein [Bacteroidales bacterium]
MKKSFDKRPRWFRKLFVFIKKASLPGFDHVPIYDVFSFFFLGIKNGALTVRASAIAYSFFLAIFPAIIFFFTLIPHIPIPNFQAELLNSIHNLLPENVFLTIQSTVEEIVTRKRFDLTSIGFFSTLVFAASGIAAMITSFNASYHHLETRSWVNKQLVAVLLVFIFCFLLATSVILIIFSGRLINLFESKEILNNQLLITALNIGRWAITLGGIFLSISSLYYLAPARKQKFRFFTAGSSLASLFVVLTSVGMSTYVNNLGHWNKLYGSIGTLIALLIWLFINSLVLLIGFELNVSIKNARVQTPSAFRKK